MEDYQLRNRIEVLKAMHTLVYASNLEDIYEHWIVLVPDEPTEEDFEFIARHEEDMEDVTQLFYALMKAQHRNGGMFVGGYVFGAKE